MKFRLRMTTTPTANSKRHHHHEDNNNNNVNIKDKSVAKIRKGGNNDDDDDDDMTSLSTNQDDTNGNIHDHEDDDDDDDINKDSMVAHNAGLTGTVLLSRSTTHHENVNVVITAVRAGGVAPSALAPSPPPPPLNMTNTINNNTMSRSSSSSSCTNNNNTKLLFNSDSFCCSQLQQQQEQQTLQAEIDSEAEFKLEEEMNADRRLLSCVGQNAAESDNSRSSNTYHRHNQDNNQSTAVASKTLTVVLPSTPPLPLQTKKNQRLEWMQQQHKMSRRFLQDVLMLQQQQHKTSDGDTETEWIGSPLFAGQYHLDDDDDDNDCHDDDDRNKQVELNHSDESSSSSSPTTSSRNDDDDNEVVLGDGSKDDCKPTLHRQTGVPRHLHCDAVSLKSSTRKSGTGAASKATAARRDDLGETQEDNDQADAIIITTTRHNNPIVLLRQIKGTAYDGDDEHDTPPIDLMLSEDELEQDALENGIPSVVIADWDSEHGEVSALAHIPRFTDPGILWRPPQVVVIMLQHCNHDRRIAFSSSAESDLPLTTSTSVTDRSSTSTYIFSSNHNETAVAGAAAAVTSTCEIEGDEEPHNDHEIDHETLPDTRKAELQSGQQFGSWFQTSNTKRSREESPSRTSATSISETSTPEWKDDMSDLSFLSSDHSVTLFDDDDDDDDNRSDEPQHQQQQQQQQQVPGQTTTTTTTSSTTVTMADRKLAMAAGAAVASAVDTPNHWKGLVNRRNHHRSRFHKHIERVYL